MKTLRKPLIRKVISIFFLILFVESTIQISSVYALTTGPHQPEYTSYESPDATDMVNLLTGDFSFSMPILEVPGPEGGFTLPLAYNAGIGPDQEASWVGLGWSMNAGAITRNINEFPDDANGEVQSITVQDLKGVKGWSSSILGLVDLGWDTQNGHYGAVSLFSILGYDWSSDGRSVGVAGLNVSVSGQGVTFDPIQFSMALMTVASWGSTAAARGIGQSVVGAIAKQEAIGMAMGAGMEMASAALRPASATNIGGNWEYSKTVKQKLFHKEYWYWLDKTRGERMYGTMNLDKANSNTESFSTTGITYSIKNGGIEDQLLRYKNEQSSFNQGSASDVNYNTEGGEYRDINNPAVLGYDNYSVKAAGISGSISPYRFDVGSVSMPREISKNHVRLHPVQWSSYKVPFIYQGTISNSYFHQVGGATEVTTPTPYTGTSLNLGSSIPSENTRVSLELNDVVLKDQRVRSDLNSILEPTKRNNLFEQGNHVEWLTNKEIGDGTTYNSGFLDFLNVAERQQFRANKALGNSSRTQKQFFTSSSSFPSSLTNIPVNSSVISELGTTIDLEIAWFDSETVYLDDLNSALNMSYVNRAITKNLSTNTITLSSPISEPTMTGKYAVIMIKYYTGVQLENAIGGYCITSPSGVTYHFALPVYDYDYETQIIDAASPAKKTIIRRSSPFANTWLLTTITGPDFVDRIPYGIADENDWGYWVKMNYMNHTDATHYKWRLPYDKDNIKVKKSPDNLTQSYAEGYKQLYYLNTIETRSHVALFLKSTRLDSESANSPTTLKSLKLDEIVLVTREHYNKLKSNYALDDFSNRIDKKCMSLSPTGRSFVDANAIKRIVFNNDHYDLCLRTPNSIAANQGKLTLKSVAIYGRSNKKIIPDYKFEYANNFDYNENYWDGWGYYNSGGTSSGSTHKASNNDPDGAAWSLSKIITPLGSEILINYERDDYSTVSADRVFDNSISFSNPNIKYYYPSELPIKKLYMTNPSASFIVNDKVWIMGEAWYQCPSASYQSKSYSGEFTITAIGSNYIMLNDDYMGLGTCGATQTGSYIQFDNQYGQVNKISKGKKGGDTRVASIVMKDEWGVENKLRYLYKEDDGLSSGVVAKEPEYIKTGGSWTIQDNLPGYPFTPVMYGKVTLLTGILTTDSEYHTKQVYEFETPNPSMVSKVKNTIYPKNMVYSYEHCFYLNDTEICVDFIGFAEIYQHSLINKTSKIGSLKSIKIYDKNGTLHSQSQMEYTDSPPNDRNNPYEGVYAEGVIMADNLRMSDDDKVRLNKINRTTTIYYPYVLQKVVNTKDGFSSETQSLKFDFITGNVLEKLNKSPLGLMTKSVSIPAYKISQYLELGSKASSPTNKHMLMQNAATYTYKTNTSGDSTSLITASAEIWKKDWAKYRIDSSGYFIDKPEGPDVWRKNATYVWKGNNTILQPDGTHKFSVADKFNFASPASNAKWQYVGEVERYDHFSMPLSAKDLNGIYSSSRMGYQNRFKIAEASNANFSEIAFSSAEDLDPITNYFGGEIARSTGSVFYKSKGQLTSANTGDANITEAHTGDALLAITTGTGFVYKTKGLSKNKTYKAAVWTNSVNGRIYYKLNGSTTEQLSSAPSAQSKVGNWYLITCSIPTGSTFTSLEVGVKSATGAKVVFDDFRFQPMDAAMVCYVYDPLDFEFATGATSTPKFEYVLDNDNFFTKYEYNERGMLKRIFSESLTYGVKKTSENEDDFRRFYVNQ